MTGLPGKNDPARNKMVKELEEEITIPLLRAKKKNEKYHRVWKFLRALGFDVGIVPSQYGGDTYNVRLMNWEEMEGKIYTKQQLVDAWPGGWFSRLQLRDGESFYWKTGQYLELHYHDGHWWFEKK